MLQSTPLTVIQIPMTGIAIMTIHIGSTSGFTTQLIQWNSISYHIK